MDVIKYLVLILYGIRSISGFDEATLRFYYKTIDEYTELPLEQGNEIFLKPWYNHNRGTVFFAHGFKGHPKGPAVTSVIKAYLETDRYNVVLLNWEALAAQIQPSIANSYLNWAAPNARKVGLWFSEVLMEMSETLNLNETHLIGHSLGAQLFGIAGNHLAEHGHLIPWITGLDPASIGFENRPPIMRLNDRSALFVDIVHSDPSKYGYKRPQGTVDYWPNFTARGPVIQPGCDHAPNPMFTPLDLCNHNRCWELWIDALKYPNTLIGCHAKNYRAWKGYSDSERNITTIVFGSYNPDVIRGDYYFVTKESSPYGLGQEGL